MISKDFLTKHAAEPFAIQGAAICDQNPILRMQLQRQCSRATKAKRLLPLDHSRSAQHILLRAPAPDDLDANRKPCRGKTDWHRRRGLACHVPGKRIWTPSPIAIGKSVRNIAFGGPRCGGNDRTYEKVETIEECPRRG